MQGFILGGRIQIVIKHIDLEIRIKETGHMTLGTGYRTLDTGHRGGDRIYYYNILDKG
jgi:hypothetical protein